MQHRSPGYTLPELLLILAVLVLLSGLAVPGLRGFLHRHSGEALASELGRTLNLARAAAVDSGRMVTLCRSRDGLSCNGEWADGILVFTDANADRLINADDRIVRYSNALRVIGSLSFRSFPNRQYLQFTPMGFTNKQNGSFTWCPPSGETTLAQQVIFTQSGRIRLARDRNGDGIKEGTDGKAISCSN